MIINGSFYLSMAQINLLPPEENSHSVWILGEKPVFAFEKRKKYVFRVLLEMISFHSSFSWLYIFFSLLLRKLLQRGLAPISRGKCGSPLIKVTLTERSISNIRHIFTLKERITLGYAERSSHTKWIPSRCLRFTKCLSGLHFLVLRSSSGETKTRLKI